MDKSASALLQHLIANPHIINQLTDVISILNSQSTSCAASTDEANSKLAARPDNVDAYTVHTYMGKENVSRHGLSVLHDRGGVAGTTMQDTDSTVNTCTMATQSEGSSQQQHHHKQQKSETVGHTKTVMDATRSSNRHSGGGETRLNHALPAPKPSGDAGQSALPSRVSHPLPRHSSLYAHTNSNAHEQPQQQQQRHQHEEEKEDAQHQIRSKEIRIRELESELAQRIRELHELQHVVSHADASHEEVTHDGLSAAQTAAPARRVGVVSAAVAASTASVTTRAVQTDAAENLHSDASAGLANQMRVIKAETASHEDEKGGAISADGTNRDCRLGHVCEGKSTDGAMKRNTEEEEMHAARVELSPTLTPINLHQAVARMTLKRERASRSGVNEDEEEEKEKMRTKVGAARGRMYAAHNGARGTLFHTRSVHRDAHMDSLSTSTTTNTNNNHNNMNSSTMYASGGSHSHDGASYSNRSAAQLYATSSTSSSHPPPTASASTAAVTTLVATDYYTTAAPSRSETYASTTAMPVSSNYARRHRTPRTPSLTHADRIHATRPTPTHGATRSPALSTNTNHLATHSEVDSAQGFIHRDVQRTHDNNRHEDYYRTSHTLDGISPTTTTTMRTAAASSSSSSSSFSALAHRRANAPASAFHHTQPHAQQDAVQSRVDRSKGGGGDVYEPIQPSQDAEHASMPAISHVWPTTVYSSETHAWTDATPRTRYRARHEEAANANTQHTITENTMTNVQRNSHSHSSSTSNMRNHNNNNNNNNNTSDGGSTRIMHDYPPPAWGDAGAAVRAETPPQNRFLKRYGPDTTATRTTRIANVYEPPVHVAHDTRSTAVQSSHPPTGTNTTTAAPYPPPRPAREDIRGSFVMEETSATADYKGARTITAPTHPTANANVNAHAHAHAHAVVGGDYSPSHTKQDGPAPCNRRTSSCTHTPRSPASLLSTSTWTRVQPSAVKLAQHTAPRPIPEQPHAHVAPIQTARAPTLLSPVPARSGTSSAVASGPTRSPSPLNPKRGPSLPRRFIFTGLKEDEPARLREAIAFLGHDSSVVECDLDEPPPFHTTHIILRGTPRSVKALCGVVSGKWLVPPEYVYNSVSAGFWLDEYDEGGLRLFPPPLKCQRFVLAVEHRGIREKLGQVILYGGGEVISASSRPRSTATQQQQTTGRGRTANTGGGGNTNAQDRYSFMDDGVLTLTSGDDLLRYVTNSQA